MAEFCSSNVNSMKTEGQTADEEWRRRGRRRRSNDHLDHIPLLQRRKLLLSSREQSDGVVKKEDEECNPECLLDGNGCLEFAGDGYSEGTKVETAICSDQDFDMRSSSGDGMLKPGSPNLQAPRLNNEMFYEFADELDHIVLKERQRMLVQRKKLSMVEPSPEGIVPVNMDSQLKKSLNGMNSMATSTLSNLVKVKDEPLNSLEKDTVGNSSFWSTVSVKSEPGVSNELHVYNTGHTQLRDPMKLQITGEDSKPIIGENYKCLGKVMPSAVDYIPSIPEHLQPIKLNCPRKRKKTATDSIATALEEDAPGLLQVLIEQGVSVDEIKLYGETDIDEPIDESFSEDGFAELEAVISKLFLTRNSFLKLAPVRHTKESKPSYCLACLFSLVEQARYLQFRNWPAEWGWCRDLQSFVFIFERHRRIVLERPEYGYATYFFELVDSAPIDWQIKRLVTSMKLTSCGRITLIENKALLVGEDLTEGEAQVLMQYGWTPKTGLGTMLNYCDRVVHDRKNEKDTSEWRSKIGKLLMDGYNGGSLISTTLHINEDIGCGSGELPQIKMEL